MEIIVAVTVVVGAVALLNLVLTFGMMRRMRQYQEMLAAGGGHGHGGPPDGLAVGAQVGDFDARTVDGRPLSQADFTGTTLVGFFSEGCEPCEKVVPRFIDSVTRGGAGRRVLAVVRGEEGGDFSTRLTGVGDVVTGSDAQVVADAFEVKGYPTLMLVGAGGRVEAAGVDLDRLPELASA